VILYRRYTGVGDNNFTADGWFASVYRSGEDGADGAWHREQKLYPWGDAMQPIGPAKLAEGDSVIWTEHDSNGSKISG
jgi:hypothetical protein